MSIFRMRSAHRGEKGEINSNYSPDTSTLGYAHGTAEATNKLLEQ